MREGSYTPWGPAQFVSQPLEGVTVVSTASHGGIKLSRAQNAKIPAAARAPGGWYEEDCCAAVPAYVFGLGDKEQAAQCIRRYETKEAQLALGV